jgi:hypothetical protein
LPELPAFLAHCDQRRSPVLGIAPPLEQTLPFHPLYQLRHPGLAGSLGLGQCRQAHRAFTVDPIEHQRRACTERIAVDQVAKHQVGPERDHLGDGVGPVNYPSVHEKLYITEMI